MGSGGTEWESNDTFDTLRLNQKTLFVGTGEQITNLITSPQTGQEAFCTESDSTFRANKLNYRNKDNDTWFAPQITESAEQNSTALASGAGETAGSRRYIFYTLPSTEKFYIITEFNAVSSTASGNVVFGCDIVDSATPSGSNSILAALSREVAGPAVNGQAFSVTEISSRAIPAGTLLGIWVHFSATNVLRNDGTSTTVYSKSMAYSSEPDFADANSWTSATASRPQIQIKFRGYS